MIAAVGDVNSAKIVMTIVVSTVPISGISVMKNAATEITKANGPWATVRTMKLKTALMNARTTMPLR